MKTKYFKSNLGVLIVLFTASLFFSNCSKSDTPAAPTTLSIGQSYGGGIIFYIDGTQQHGLIAAPSDQTSSTWGASTITNATATALGTGQLNTTTIINALGVGSYAAAICDQLVLNGYSDWFLPSRDELSYLYNQKALVGGFGAPYAYYWTSSEKAANAVWIVNFVDGTQLNYAKFGTSASTRAIRAF